MNCYIIDDDIRSVKALTKYINKIPELILVGSNINPVLALEEVKLSQQKIDIIFLDVEMPELTGMEVADLLPNDISIIFVTAYMQEAYNAFEKNAIDFILKPYTFERLIKAIRKVQGNRYGTAIEKRNSSNKQMFIKTGLSNKLVQVSLEEIINIEVIDHYLLINTVKEKYTTYMTLRDMEEVLPQDSFVRVHRRYILNVKMIRSIQGNQIFMNNGHIFPISRTYKESFIKNIQHKLAKNHKI